MSVGKAAPIGQSHADISHPQAAISQPQTAISQQQAVIQKPQAAIGHLQAAISQSQAEIVAFSYAFRMQRLYTKNAIPDELLQLWHSTAPDGKFQTFAMHNQDCAKIDEAWPTFILQKLLHVDSNPTLAHFFAAL